MRIRTYEISFIAVTKQKPPKNLLVADLRGLRYVSASFSCLIVILEEFFEHVVDETSDDAFHDSFNELSDTSFDALTGFLHRYHPLTQNYCSGVG